MRQELDIAVNRELGLRSEPDLHINGPQNNAPSVIHVSDRAGDASVNRPTEPV